MPKLKTHSGAKKRIRLTNNNKVVRMHTSGNHFLSKKSGGRKREIARPTTLTGKSVRLVKRKLGA